MTNMSSMERDHLYFRISVPARTHATALGRHLCVATSVGDVTYEKNVIYGKNVTYRTALSQPAAQSSMRDVMHGEGRSSGARRGVPLPGQRAVIYEQQRHL